MMIDELISCPIFVGIHTIRGIIYETHLGKWGTTEKGITWD